MRRIKIISDASNAVNIINGEMEVPLEVEDIRQKIHLLKGRVSSVNIRHVSRDLIKDADVLAKQGICRYFGLVMWL